ncbi:GNAT family N-acetyltransferase [Alkalihalobacillus sp. NPDC078783]
MVQVKRLQIQDIPGLIRLSEEVGWDYTRRELLTIFNTGMVFGCKEEDQLIACAAIIPYDLQTIASLGLVIVHPECRGLGLGRKVTTACIQSVNLSQSTVILVATEEGKVLYEKIGFKTVHSIYKYTHTIRESIHVQGNPQILPYQDKQFHQMVDIDEKAFGDRREGFLRKRIKQSEKSVVLMDEAGEMKGYSLLIQTSQNAIIGPVVSENRSQAVALIQEQLVNLSGNVRIDLTNPDQEIIQFLKGMGFEQVTQPPLMVLGKGILSWRNNQLVALASQAFG